MIILDTECYPNYLLIAVMGVDKRNVVHFERYPGQDFEGRRLMSALSKHTVVTFNGNDYDLPMIAAALDGWDNAALKRWSDKLITSKGPAWMKMRDAGLHVPREWDHIDLINVAPGQSSLKIYGGRMHAPRLQDLPYDPDDEVNEEQRDQLRRYCVNDLETTDLLRQTLDGALDLRAKMSEQYGMDLRSKSDAQIAETVIRSELSKQTGQKYSAPKLANDYSFRYRDPGNLEFHDPQLVEAFDQLKGTDFGLSKNGSVEMPEWLKKTVIRIGSGEYRMGIGGLHSSEKRQCVHADDEHCIMDLDVASYYPSIILQQQLAPQTLGEPFLEVYRSIVERRLRAKREGDKTTADSLKIAINGSFGKLGSKYSFLYSPDLLIQTTITGQLALLMLIERMEANGVPVVSANTDGIVIRPRIADVDTVEAVAWDWMLDTSYELERTDYRTVASANVNNYLAVKTEGSVKGKGWFAGANLMKNPDAGIVYTAVIERIANGADIERTVKGCDDFREFVTVRQVKGGAVWQGQPLGKAVRFYRSTSVVADECIHYATNGNKVPKSEGCKPAMDMPDGLPGDIDYDWYITEAEKLLCEVGHG